MSGRSIKEILKEDVVNKISFFIKRGKAIPVMVYQMGKVGSSSIYHPLKKVYPGVVVHTHQFNQKAWYWEVRKLHKMFYDGKQEKFKIISLIREPIGRNMSEYFHRFHDYTGVAFQDNKFSLEEIKDKFLSGMDHDFPLDWFDNNFNKHFGIDVYKTKFSDSGYDYYRTENVDVLLMKHNLADEKKEELINTFLDINNFKMQVRNVGNKKEYSSTYNEFKSKVNLPDWYKEKMYDSKYYQHFYN